MFQIQNDNPLDDPVTFHLPVQNQLEKFITDLALKPELMVLS